MKATWNNTVIAESDDTVWFYPEPRPEAHLIHGRVAFWKGVVVEE